MPPFPLFRTADGWLFSGALTPAFRVKLMPVLERVDLLADPRLQGSPLAFGIPEIKDFVRRELDPILATRPTVKSLGEVGSALMPGQAGPARPHALLVPQKSTRGLSSPLHGSQPGSPLQPG